MANEKDRFGDKLRDAERGREDSYFAERDRELLAKLKTGSEEFHDEKISAEARGRCPRDGGELHPRKLHGVAIEECPNCKGMWLDEGEWKVLAERERGGFFGRWFLGDRDA
jgi:hypothetical protein